MTYNIGGVPVGQNGEATGQGSDWVSAKRGYGGNADPLGELIGYYKPDQIHMDQVLQELDAAGVDTDSIEVGGF